MNHLFRDCPATNEAIWGDRNKRVHEGKVTTGKEVANFINSYMGEITSLERRDLNFTGGKIRWKRPQGGFIKINFDGAFYKSQNRSASGVVIRFQHAPRSANSLAHILATETLRRGEEIYLDMGVPEYAEEQGRYEMRREPD
ncbi:hypothetical protein GOBAR_DD27488 [Gossypium barbadense]|nr:hypothetical protein GOBAR_DD27488 [Gossypium barbadense]